MLAQGPMSLTACSLQTWDCSFAVGEEVGEAARQTPDSSCANGCRCFCLDRGDLKSAVYLQVQKGEHVSEEVVKTGLGDGLCLV